MYASSVLFVAKFGLQETTQLLQDEERLLTEQLLKDAMAGTWTGTPSADEQAAAMRALARLERQLSTSSSLMDGYLRAVMALPLAADDANTGTLEDCCLALARCGLADDADNATDRIEAAAQTWRQWLKDIAARRVQLVMPSGDAPAPTGSVRSGRARSSIDWSGFGPGGC